MLRPLHRWEHQDRPLHRRDLAGDPLEQFLRWYREAEETGLRYPNAMALATATGDGWPSVRMVLLRAVDEHGFVFYTNLESRKGQELAKNPRAALLFYWEPLERQVRIEGHVELVSDVEADEYFATRPYGSQISAWASAQSQPIASREELEQRYHAFAEQFPEGAVPRPPFWGGFRVRPAMYEFWQGRPDRLHDRFRYKRQPDGSWSIERLQP
ncbi:pyridoxamine 5'-phosphate oxidase [Thermomicrobium sp. CFH 73360]|uniref:pyridoxamine 5'-phosphate oxidase n=1 Tax=Thermomicrobium sp. CFH 73360 TaxID=2951987 RepID=UPI002076D629|nr:pyridoxamine 5'-phosphate oxidase [Thermomicrobium sp. CFH 73360]